VEPAADDAVIPALVQSGGYPAEFVEANKRDEELAAAEETASPNDV
jgi:hypothetical protein